MKHTFAKIKQARKQLGLQQSEFADKIGSNQKTVSWMESGKSEFMSPELMAFLYAEGFDLNSIFDPDAELAMRGSENDNLNDNQNDNLLHDYRTQFIAMNVKLEAFSDQMEDFMLKWRTFEEFKLEVSQILEDNDLKKVAN